MDSIVTSLIVFACIFGGAILGMFLSPRLPQGHLGEESKRVLTLGSGVVATMAALVLGLLVASAKGTYDAQNNEVLDVCAKIALMDRILKRYGPDADPARQQLRATFTHALERLQAQSDSADHLANLNTSAAAGAIEKVQELAPTNESQRVLKSQAISLSFDLVKTRLLISEQATSQVSLPLLGMVVFWMSINFVSFGLFAPRNATVIVAFILCAFAVSGAIFLILELYRPFGGLIHVSTLPLRNVLDQMGN